MQKDKFSGKGKFIGFVAYIAMLILFSNSLPCSESSSCSSGDIFLSILCAIGLLAPAYVAAGIASEIFPDK
jgi:hypothetical protein